MIVAHKSDDGRLESIETHATEVAEMAKAFASKFGGDLLGYAAGLLHDCGKISHSFQNRILRNGPKVEHSAAGAKALIDTKTVAGLLLAYCIAGHHGGLPNYGTATDTQDGATLVAKLKRETDRNANYLPFLGVEDIGALLPKALPVQPIGGKAGGFSAAFLVRMLFSCLVDADFLCTEKFMRGEKVARGLGKLTRAMLEDFEGYVAEHLPAPTKPIDIKRCAIRAACEEKAMLPPGLFTLTVPTGGGKTLSSLAFALHHALRHGKERIIYVIPYTSIIDQTAAIFRRVLGDNSVLEHHSNVHYDDGQEEMSIARLAAENWDAPVVITTNVQFFESLFANSTSKCRKLHNIVNSVIVFDEAQMLPVPYLRPSLWALAELIQNYHCTTVLMSATQPALRAYFPDNLKATEMCEDIGGLYAFFRRTKFEHFGELTREQMGERLRDHHQVLCIVNNRKHAQQLYSLLPQDGGTFHLSTLMPAVLRLRTMRTIRERLSAGQPCRVVSTSLIEAGVDLDFPVVYRQEAGLDSQIQAAGRCNREGKRTADESIVYIFKDAACNMAGLPNALRLPIEVTRMVAESHDDLMSPEAIAAYFTSLYKNRGAGLDQKGIVVLLESCIRANFPFVDIAQAFRLIENDTATVFIPLDAQAKTIANQLRGGTRSRSLMRAAGPYQVNVYQRDMEALRAAGMVENAKIFKDGRLIDDERITILLQVERAFNEETGLEVPDLGVGLFF